MTWARLLFTSVLLALTALSTFGQTNSVVTVNSDNVLVLNGRKVFPIGFSPGPPTNGKTPTGGDGLQELRDAGALLFRISQTANWGSQVIADQQAALDWAQQHGMYCWVNLRELSSFSATDTNTPATLRTIVDTFRNHPALGLWKNADEAWWSGISAADLQRGYQTIKQEDTNHPIVQTHAPRGTVSDLQPYNSAADVLALDIYPVGYPPGANSLLTNKEISIVGDYADFLGQVANYQKQCWMVEQIAWSGATPPGKTLRFPTYQQSRYMAYQAIVRGARGLMFYGGNVAATLNAQDAPLGWNWTFWNSCLKPVVQQLGDNSQLASALVVSNSTLPITISGTSFPDLEFCVREAPPYLYILACKREGATVQVTFNGLPTAAGTGELLYEGPRVVSAQNGQFTDWFGPFEVHAYRFNLTNQIPVITSQPQNQTNYPGTTAMFTFSASGVGTLAYQWRKNGVNMSNGGNVFGANSTSLVLSNVTAADVAAYDAVVSGFGSVTTAPAATLTLLAYQSSQVPAISSQPQSRTNIIGTSATFIVGVTGNGPFGYRWRKNGALLFDGGIISGSGTPSLTLQGVSPGDAGGYDVIVSGYTSVTSSLANLTIITSTNSGLYFYEPFNYNNFGASVSSNTPANWSYGGSGANDLNVTPGSLSYTGLLNSAGASVTNGGNGLGVRRYFGTNLSSGQLYFSGLFRMNDLGLGVWAGTASQVGALTAPDSANFRLAIMAKLNSATGYVFGVQKGGSGATNVFDTTEYHAGDTVFLVAKYDFNVLPNAVYLWIDPPASTFGSPTDPALPFLSASSGVDGYTIDRFNMRQNTTASVPAAMQWDELRAGVSWGDVTPPAVAPPPVMITGVQKSNGGPLQFTYSHNSAVTYSVYSSSNLLNWFPSGSATQTAPNFYQYSDPFSTNAPKRFYQLRSP